MLRGRTLIGEGTGIDSNNTQQTFTINNTGGEYTHKLTVEEMPSHSHKFFSYYGGVANGSAIQRGWTGDTAGESTYTSATGNSNFHNNIQPYIVTYMWKRIA